MIEIEGLNRSFGDGDSKVDVLKDINLEVGRGECIILKGVSGSGKTTLLSIIAGLDRPSSGKVIVDGEAIAKLPDMHISEFRAKKIGMIFQNFNLIEHLSAAENVMIPLIPSGLDMDEVTDMTNKAMELANISHKADTMASRLSGGEKQRVAIARALVADPMVILCDEPTANLDRANSLQFIETMKELHELGKTIVIATHDPLFDNLDFANRVIPMEDGKIVDE